MKKSLFFKFSSENIFKSLKKNYFLMAHFRVCIVFSLLFFSKSFSQENIASGLENIHISQGAFIVQKNNKTKNIETIDSNVSISQTQNENFSENDCSENTKNSIIENKFKTKQKKKLTKKIEQKVIKKIEDKTQFVCICNGNKNNKTNLTSSIHNSDFFINSHNDYSIGKYIKSEYHFVTFLFVYKKSIHTLYKFHQSKFVENSLFSRPPPYLFS